MLKIQGIARNLLFDVRESRGKGGEKPDANAVELAPTAEIVLILYETDWSMTVTGDSARNLKTEVVRFGADEPSLRRAIASLTGIVDELRELNGVADKAGTGDSEDSA